MIKLNKLFIGIFIILFSNLSCSQKMDNELNISPKIFENKDTEKVFETIVDEIYNRKIDFENIKNFENPIKNLIYIFDMDGQVSNGGVIQFVDNSTGDHFEETLLALKEIKAVEYVKILEDVKSHFPNGYIPNNTEIRRNLIDSLAEKLTQEEHWELEETYEKYDTQYYSNEKKLHQYVIEYLRKSI